MDRNDGPTVFDINKPQTYGASPSSRPIITGHQPTMPDPMVNPSPDIGDSGSRINVQVGSDRSATGIDPDSLASSLFASDQGSNEGAPQTSPSFRPPSSDMSGISAPPSARSFSDVSPTPSPEAPSVFDHRSANQKDAKKSKGGKSAIKLLLGLFVLLAILAGLYGAIDKGLILDNVNLPFHIFKQDEPVNTNTAPSTTASTPAVPSGFTSTKLVESNLTFAYPTTWGAPTAAVDQGFTKRSAKAKPDASYAFLVTFPDNKDVQIAITSAKYLPPTRPSNATLYYDFLQWCTGTSDGKYYYGVLASSTADGVDTPTTVVCNQGPLNNVVKLDSDTIEQTNVKSNDGSVLGDIYTKNLTDKSYVVVRVKDATMKNGTQIKTLLETVKPLQ